MRRAIRRAAMILGVGLVVAGTAEAQVPDVVGLPAPGDPTGRRLGWRISNGFGYNAIGPRGTGYYTGLYTPTLNEDGQSPAYNPIFNSLNTGPGSYVPPERRGKGLFTKWRRR